MKVVQTIEELVGNTPLLRMHKVEKAINAKAQLYAKLEYLNPAGSAKDRIALSILDAAERSGKLQPHGTIIEPTSGNTGVGLAAIGAARGYRVIIVMPDTMSRERQLLMKAYGAELVLTDGTLGMQGAIDEAEALKTSIAGSIVAGQFTNLENPNMHYRTTGPEIYKALEGKVDVFLAGVGTGGTISGVGKYLKEQNPAIEVIALEPAKSPLLSKGIAGAHGIQGIGANFIPATLDKTAYDRVMTIEDEVALHYARMAAHKEGLFVGISSGAAIAAAQQLATENEYAGKNIVAFLPDGGDRYLSTALLDDDDIE